MKAILSSVGIGAIILAGPVFADPQSDAQYIVEQTVTEEMFRGAIQAQRSLIIGATQHRFQSMGIEMTDPDRFFDVFIEEFIAEFTQSMKTLTVPVYVENFTPEQLAQIATFYKTPTGQVLLSKTPMLMSEGARLGAQAGKQAGVNAGERMAERDDLSELFSREEPSILQRALDALR